MAQILDGLALSKIVRAELAERVAKLRAVGIVPRLDVLVAAQDPASQSYVRMKRKWAEAAGMEGESTEITDNTPQEESATANPGAQRKSAGARRVDSASSPSSSQRRRGPPCIRGR